MQWEQTVYWCALFTFIIRDFFRFVKSVFAYRFMQQYDRRFYLRPPHKRRSTAGIPYMPAQIRAISTGSPIR